MERLSSCYFCGDAVDASLETYSLVPDDYDRTLDTGRQVVLCPTCRRKLTTVIEHVLEAAFGASTDIDESIDVLQDVDADEPMIARAVERMDDPAESGRKTAGEPEPGRAGSNGDDSGNDGDPGASAGRTDPESEAAEDPESGAAGADSRTSPDDSATESDDDPAAADGEETAADGPAGEPSDDGTEGDRNGATGGTGTDRQYTRAEYNRIVRLLQNREFPVEIDEIEVVARNAYGIDEATCHAVLNALVERGVLADRGEELVRG